MKVKLIVTLVLAIVVSVPSLSMGESTHYFDCTQCHLNGGTLNQLGGANVCISCHSGPGLLTTLNAGSRYNSTGTHATQPNGNFDVGDCSDVYNSGVISNHETSHHWAVPTTVNAAAGSKEPNSALYRNMYSRYGTSTGKVTCTRCHDPHGKFDTNPKLLRLSNDNVTPMTENELCEACHSDFVSMGAPSYNGLMTHPIIDSAQLNAIILDNPAYDMAGIQNYNSAAPYTNSAVLVDGGISCSSCHGPHFTDSNIKTPDGPGASGGDGLLLRSGGPTRTGVDRNETAQLRSDLCQTCHTYQLHGKASEALPITTGVNRIGCLDCHGGHNYNSASMSDFVLAYASPDAPPTRVDRATVAPVNSVTFPVFSDATLKRSSWSDDTPLSANGFCEQCHGDINQSGTTLGDLGEHSSGAESCVTCHPHNNSTHSFGLETSAAVCGNCHGFPPYKTVSGDKFQVHDPLGEDGGYAINLTDKDPDFWNYYNSPGVTYYKDEATTAHKTHAGRDYDNKYYFFGDGSSSSNCQPCHGPGAGTTNHRQPGVIETFRDVFWNDVSTGELRTGTAALSPNYDEVTARCDNVYCHSNGFPRTGPTSASYNTLTQITPTWDPLSDGGGQGGIDFIWASPSRCNFCHGDSAATMAPGGPNKDNSPAHIVHLNEGYTCDVCHVTTAVDNSTLQDLATHGDNGGTHVNSTVEVVYNANVLNGKLASDSYTGAEAIDGTCSVYCHDAPEPGSPNGTGRSADWDTDTNLGCNDCHDDQLTPGTTTGSHERHVPNSGKGLTGPQLTCDECHGVDSGAGTHASHIDGILDLVTAGGGFTDICEECHGYDPGEVLPEWGVANTTDCATCHGGARCGSVFNGKSPLLFQWADTSGHNRPTGSPYPGSGYPAANADCETCHLSDSASHWDNDTWYNGSGLGADLMLRTDNGFVLYVDGGNPDSENDHCANCHGAAGERNHPTHAAANTDNQDIKSHRGKKCVACHSVHGDPSNIMMIWSNSYEQNTHDDDITGKFVQPYSVIFNSVTGADSFDEDDPPAGVDGSGNLEDNKDDLCAVCHPETRRHNNIAGKSDGNHSGPGNQLGTNCTAVCHAEHNDSGGAAFTVGIGTSCAQCHLYPPQTGAHLLHSRVTATDLSDADRSDCAYCHEGADLYTYDVTDDRQVKGLNHSYNVGRIGILWNTVGFSNNGTWTDNTDDTCIKACHNTELSDGTWGDADGLACDKCHYYEGTGNASGSDNDDHGSVLDGRAEPISTVHNKHLDSGKECIDCHDMAGSEYNNGNPIPGGANGLAHINYNSVGSDIIYYNGAAYAEQNEAGFDEGGGVSDVLASLTYNSSNTCATAGGLGCHAASTTANWDNPFDGTTNDGCKQCHTTTNGNADYDPTSGLHNNATDPTVTGNSHDDDFLDGSGGNATCVTCHTGQPTITPGDHMNNNLDNGVNKITVYANAGYNSTNNTCATVSGCHSSTEVGSPWEYKWSTTVYNTTGAQCDNCHGRWTDWRTGVTHRMDLTPQGTHGAIGYGCKDCHALEAASGNYAYDIATNDWNEAVGETSNHGDGLITINAYNTAFVRNVGGGSDLSGCSECHAADDGVNPGQYSFYTTNWTNSSVLGDQVPITCSSCHGGTNSNAVDESNFWPDGLNAQNDSEKNNRGAHELHMIRLAEAVYPDDATLGNPDATLAALFTNVSPNYAGDAEARQTELCAYCHNNPGVNPGHNDDGGLPAETLASANDSNTPGQGFFPLWDTNRSGSRDSADYDTTGAGSCYLSSCHYDRATDANATNYGWYADNPTSCEICHDPNDVTTNVNVEGLTHQEHLNSASLTGRTITCDDCHQTASETVAWGTPGVAPNDNHINNTFMDDGAGSVAYTYNDGWPKSCGTNDCHNIGDGINPPALDDYPWDGGPLADCTICHLDPPDTDTHPEHMGSTTYVNCLNCHTPGNDVDNHINKSVTYNTTTIGNPPGDGSCVNTCHIAGDPLDWQGDLTDLACTDCHNDGASYIGGTPYMPTSGLHVLNNIVTLHDGTLGTPDGNCINCHDAAAPVSAANHGDGVFQTASQIIYTFNSATVLGYDPTPVTGGCMAVLGCHRDGGDWRREWNDVFDEVVVVSSNPGDDVCKNCHGAPATFADDNSAGEWRWDEADLTTTDHTDPYYNAVGGDSALDQTTNMMGSHTTCETCHGWGHGSYDILTNHNNNLINMNVDGTSYNDSTGGCDAAGCHGAGFVLNTNSGFNVQSGNYGTGGAGACNLCHGSTNIWPDGTRDFGLKWPDRPGLHDQHMAALLAKGIGVNNACGYCHPGTAGEPGHATNGDTPASPYNSADMPDNITSFYKQIIGGGNDLDGLYNIVELGAPGEDTCSNIDCHFNNSYTPHWYPNTDAPETVSPLTLETGPHPNSVRAYWLSPGADTDLPNSTAYVYDMRIGTSAAAVSGANFDIATKVGGLPITYLRGELSEVIIDNLVPTNTYYVALKTRDTEGNVTETEAVSNGASPLDDSVALVMPDFFGADIATKGNDGSTVNLWWTAAEDHSMYDPATKVATPITYDIYFKDEMDGVLDMTVTDDRIITGWQDTKIELNSNIPGVTVLNDHIYHMGVRACDTHGTCDDNTHTVSITPTAPPVPPTEFSSYKPSNSSTIVKDGNYGSGVTADPLPVVFLVSGGNLSHPVRYYVDSFAVYADVGNSVETMTATLGYTSNGGGNFTAFADRAVTINTSPRGDKAYTFKFSDSVGVQVDTNFQMAIEVTGTANSISYGTSLFRGDASMGAQIVNIPPEEPVPVDIGTALNGAVVTIDINEFLDIEDGLSDTVHYDLYGSIDGGINYDYIIDEAVDYSEFPYEWDTQAAGLLSSSGVAVQIKAGDGFAHSTYNITGLGDLTAADNIKPAAITDLTAKPRPKGGVVSLEWTSPGDDYWNNGRAYEYDIRYSAVGPITGQTEWDLPSTIAVDNEPYPEFGMHRQQYEVVDLNPGGTYWFAIRTLDEAGNISGFSNDDATTTGGPRCGMCHTTGPSVVESEGNHKLHGYTVSDCTNCHGVGVATFGLDHQDGKMKMGYGPSGPVNATILDQGSYNSIVYMDGGFKMYEDTNGFGGFGEEQSPFVSQGDGVDNGGCFNFGRMGIAGCHGSAGDDPDDTATDFPTYNTPIWNADAQLHCARCHGKPNRTTDFYGSHFDATIAAAEERGGPGTPPIASDVPDQILGSPATDNRGGWDYNAATINTVEERKYIGQHEIHLNYSFRFSKGDSCNLCHPGHYVDENKLDGKHGDSIVDVQLDLNASGPDAHYNAAGIGVAGQCFDMSPYSCHPSDAEPAWDTDATFECYGCHTMNKDMAKIGHYTDPAGSLPTEAPWYEDNPGNCTWCHFAGHPTDDVGGTALILPNSSQVGMVYKSGGVHLRKQPGGVGPVYQTEAELCWGCHDQNNDGDLNDPGDISEWGTDFGLNNNSATIPDNNSDYNYGQLDGYRWNTATWYSAFDDRTSFSGTTIETEDLQQNAYSSGLFNYKSGAIQSTHTTSFYNGSSLVVDTGGIYNEAPDDFKFIRCSNCHDVHNMNFAEGDNMNGPPYLRGSWLRNPYPEDGAPQAGFTYSATLNLYENVARGGSQHNEIGGYQIDQNNGFPTAGKSLGTTAGLCTLCHGKDVDAMDYTTDVPNLWLGVNGHSNSAMGGTADDDDQDDDGIAYAANILTFTGALGRVPTLPLPVITSGVDYDIAGNPMMGYANATRDGSNELQVDGFRSAYKDKGFAQLPMVDGAYYAYINWDWAVTQDDSTIDKGYHAFTCSKCHNPHASRLPKLMITNCLDTKQNTWDDGYGTLAAQNVDWANNPRPSHADSVGRELSNIASAQNCHRLGDPTQSGTGGGWNLVTPRNKITPP